VCGAGHEYGGGNARFGGDYRHAGRLCLVQKAEGAKFQIAVSDLPTGMYFLTYSDGERTVTRKFLKK
ncbi:MAG: T9SS type A sorting domain-containing protein, partial [Bacteroidales bacterium]|nr:T9SS type A sorting domain-containing protein [Bacteroidales bacterium]